MRVVTPRVLNEYAKKMPQSKIPLLYWYKIITQSNWNSLNEVKKDFNSVDYVGNNRYVFNIKGNDFRIVVIILFVSQKAYVRFIGTHNEYTKINCKTI